MTMIFEGDLVRRRDGLPFSSDAGIAEVFFINEDSGSIYVKFGYNRHPSVDIFSSVDLHVIGKAKRTIPVTPKHLPDYLRSIGLAHLINPPFLLLDPETTAADLIKDAYTGNKADVIIADDPPEPSTYGFFDEDGDWDGGYETLTQAASAAGEDAAAMNTSIPIYELKPVGTMKFDRN